MHLSCLTRLSPSSSSSRTVATFLDPMLPSVPVYSSLPPSSLVVFLLAPHTCLAPSSFTSVTHTWHFGSYPGLAHRPSLIVRLCASWDVSSLLPCLVVCTYVSLVLYYLFMLSRWLHRFRRYRKVPRHRFDNLPPSFFESRRCRLLAALRRHAHTCMTSAVWSASLSASIVVRTSGTSDLIIVYHPRCSTSSRPLAVTW
jgi:hypothetical protein